MKTLSALLVALGLVATACGEEPQRFYTAETEENFLASCVDDASPEPLPLDADDEQRELRRSEEDLRILQNEICRCTISALEQKVPYQTFAEYDAELRADLALELQTATRNELISCIEQESAL